MTDEACFAPVRFTTADLPEHDRVSVWREHYDRMALKLDVAPAERSFFECTLVSRALPGLQLLSAAMSAVRVSRTRDSLADGNDDFIFIMNRRGAISASAHGRELSLHDGDAVLMSSAEAKVFDRHSRGRSLSLRIPRPVLAASVVDPDDAVMRLIPRHAAALKLVANYARSLMDENPLETRELRLAAVHHVHDLVALALGATRDAADLARVRGLPAARLRAAKALIMENCNRRDLSVGSVAAHLGLTPRNLQRLFETDGTTFSEFLLAQRLNRAHRMLTEPRLAQSLVGSVAYDVGFGDLSYFNRCFKQRYGATPRDIKKGATCSGPSAATSS